MGSRGPAPKRSEQRRRRNKPVTEERVGGVTKVEGAVGVEAPAPDENWHPIAKRWYASLAESGQRVFYEPSDWATAYLMAESISRDFQPQVVGVTDGGEPIRELIPLKGANLSAYLRAMTALLVTEGDRRRAAVELQRGSSDGDDQPAGVTDIRSWRESLNS